MLVIKNINVEVLHLTVITIYTKQLSGFVSLVNRPTRSVTRVNLMFYFYNFNGFNHFNQVFEWPIKCIIEIIGNIFMTSDDFEYVRN